MVLQGAGLALGRGKGRTSRSRDSGDGVLRHPQAFLHAQVGSRHGGESQQVIADRYVPVGSPNPRKP